MSTDEIILCMLEISGYFMSFNEKGVVFISVLGTGCNKWSATLGMWSSHSNIEGVSSFTLYDAMYIDV